jgi:CRP-like cAMP-binding protein
MSVLVRAAAALEDLQRRSGEPEGRAVVLQQAVSFDEAHMADLAEHTGRVAVRYLGELAELGDRGHLERLVWNSEHGALQF